MASIKNNSLSPIINKISFAEISKFWLAHLWPDRVSEIEPVSCINSDGDIDIELRKYQPHFFGLFKSRSLIGVVSTCQTSALEFRLRGICIITEFQKKGYSNKIIVAALNQILTLNGNAIVWTLGRESNFDYYSKFDFEKYKCVSNFEYGPHIILKNNNPQKTLQKIRNDIRKL